MPSWKKIIVSGSNAELNQVTATNYGGNVSGSSTSTGSFGHLQISNNDVYGTANGIAIGTGASFSSPSLAFEVTKQIDNNWLALFRNLEADAGRNFGLYIRAGTNASDYALQIRDKDDSLLTRVDGTGNILLNAGDVRLTSGNVSGSSTSTGSFGHLKLGNVDTDASFEFGRAHVGHIGYSDMAGFSHVDLDATTTFALAQNSSGKTIVNAASGQQIALKINNADKVSIDATGLSIGTDTPAHPLHVVGNAFFTGNISGSSTSTGSFGGIFTAGVSRFTGNIGIGEETAPDELLHLKQTGNDFTTIQLESTNGGTGAGSQIDMNFNGAHFYLVNHGTGRTSVSRYGTVVAGFGEILAQDSNSGLMIGTGTKNKPIIFGTNNAEVMRIEDGKVSGSAVSTGSFGRAEIAGDIFLNTSAKANLDLQGNEAIINQRYTNGGIYNAIDFKNSQGIRIKASSVKLQIQNESGTPYYEYSTTQFKARQTDQEIIDFFKVSGSSTSTGSFGRIEVGANTLAIGGTEIGKTVADNITDLDQELNTTSSPTFAGLTTTGDITAQNFIVSSSVTHMTQLFSSGSTVFGDTLDDTHQFTGSVDITGSATITSRSPLLHLNEPFGLGGDSAVRVTEDGAWRGGFIKYDGTNNLLKIGTHANNNDTTGDDITAIEITRNDGYPTFKQAYAYLNQYLAHEGDADTYLRYQTNQIDLSAGGNVFEINTTSLSGSATSTGSFGKLAMGTDAEIYYEGDEFVINQGRNASTIFRNRGTQALRVDGGAKVGIGPDIVTPANMLHIKTTGTTDAAITLEGVNSTWTIGNDYSDLGFFKLSNNTAVGTATAFAIGANSLAYFYGDITGSATTNLTLGGNITGSGNLEIAGNISGSSTSTGSFGRVSTTTGIVGAGGVSQTARTNADDLVINNSTTDGVGISILGSDSYYKSINFGGANSNRDAVISYSSTSDNKMTIGTTRASGIINFVTGNGDVSLTLSGGANGVISGSSTSTGSFGSLTLGNTTAKSILNIKSREQNSLTNGIEFIAADSSNVLFRVFENNTDEEGELQLFKGSNEKVRFRADGDSFINGGSVGIGVENPSDYNSVGNTLVVGNTGGNAGITVASSNSSYGALYFADNTSGTDEYDGAVEYNHGTRTMKFWAAANANTPNIKLESNGDVTLGANISGSSTSTGSFGKLLGDGSDITGLSSAAISSYTNTGNNRIITSVDSSTVNSEANLTFDGSTLDVTGDIVVSGDLTINGTTTTLAATNLEIADAFGFFATGSAASNVDAGIIVQSGSFVDSGSAIYHDISDKRWSVAKGVGSSETSVSDTQWQGFVATVYTSSASPVGNEPKYGVGEIHIDDDGEIYIYS